MHGPEVFVVFDESFDEKKTQKRSQYQMVNVAIRTNLLFTQKKTREKNVNIP